MKKLIQAKDVEGWMKEEAIEMEASGWKLYQEQHTYQRVAGISKIYNGYIRARKGGGPLYDLVCLISPVSSRVSKWKTL